MFRRLTIRPGAHDGGVDIAETRRKRIRAGRRKSNNASARRHRRNGFNLYLTNLSISPNDTPGRHNLTMFATRRVTVKKYYKCDQNKCSTLVKKLKLPGKFLFFSACRNNLLRRSAIFVNVAFTLLKIFTFKIGNVSKRLILRHIKNQTKSNGENKQTKRLVWLTGYD